MYQKETEWYKHPVKRAYQHIFFSCKCPLKIQDDIEKYIKEKVNEVRMIREKGVTNFYTSIEKQKEAQEIIFDCASEMMELFKEVELYFQLTEI